MTGIIASIFDRCCISLPVACGIAVRCPTVSAPLGFEDVEILVYPAVVDLEPGLSNIRDLARCGLQITVRAKDEGGALDVLGLAEGAFVSSTNTEGAAL